MPDDRDSSLAFYSPRQPRDGDGQWADTPGGGGGLGVVIDNLKKTTAPQAKKLWDAAQKKPSGTIIATRDKEGERLVVRDGHLENQTKKRDGTWSEYYTLESDKDLRAVFQQLSGWKLSDTDQNDDTSSGKNKPQPTDDEHSNTGHRADDTDEDVDDEDEDEYEDEDETSYHLPKNIDPNDVRYFPGVRGNTELSFEKERWDWNESAEEYQQTGNEKINPVLRTGDDVSDEVKTIVKHLDEMMKETRTERELTTYRGIMNPAALFGGAWKSDGDNTGLSWTDDAFVSTTGDMSMAETFSKYSGKAPEPTIMRIKLPTGQRALRMESDHYEQTELLLDRGLKFRITGDSRDENGFRQLEVEVIG